MVRTSCCRFDAIRMLSSFARATCFSERVRGRRREIERRNTKFGVGLHVDAVRFYMCVLIFLDVTHAALTLLFLHVCYSQIFVLILLFCVDSSIF
jgi:hypothetical protein